MTVFLIIFFSVYFWEGERERERERERENPKQAHTVSEEPNVGLDLMNHDFMTWAEIKSQVLNWLSHPGALKAWNFLMK